MPRGTITGRQDRFLFSGGSPLSKVQKDRLAADIRGGQTRVVKDALMKRGAKKR